MINETVKIPSRLQSWLWARDATKNWSTIPLRNEGKIIPRSVYLDMLKDTDVCPLCKNSGWFIHSGSNQLYDCVCRTLHYEYTQYKPIIDRFSSPYRHGQTIDGMSVEHLYPKARKVLNGVIKAFQGWRSTCHTWVMMYGKPGCGKSHILEAIADDFYPIALYLSAEDFNTKIRNAVGAQMLDELIRYIKGIPILLFDDWGSGYDSDFTQSTMLAIMQHRYNFAAEFPTVLTTNMDKDTVYKTDARLTDRLFEVAKWIDMSDVPSYRQRIRHD
jgi:hypothetical protein